MKTQGWKLVELLKIAATAILFAASLVMTAHAQTEPNVCWKPTYARGAGTIPGECGPGEHREAGLCYKICPAGYVGVAGQCIQSCPQGFKSAGLLDATCTKPDRFNRTAFQPTAAGTAQCNTESQGRGCEQIGGAWFVKPPPQFVCQGPLCQQTCPAGMTETANGLACRKQPAVARGLGNIPKCGSDSVAQGGLCYKNCNSGFGGAGPVCWGQCPATHPVDCGGMCGTSAKDCGGAIANQVISVLDFAATSIEAVVTLGGSTAVRTAINAAEKAAQDGAEAAITAAAKATRNLAKSVTQEQLKKELLKQIGEIGVSLTPDQVSNLTAMTAGEKFDFTSLDPTGIGAIVAAFNKPVCEMPPNSNQPVKANPKLAGQVVKHAPGEPQGVYIVGVDGIKHRIWDQMLANRNEPYTTVLRTCGLIGPGDMFTDGTYRIWPAREIGGAGLQEATVAAAVPRGKPLDNGECQAVATQLKTVGKWKFTPTTCRDGRAAPGCKS